MYKIGLIGNTDTLEPFVKAIRKNKNVNITGKTSVGTSSQLNGFHFSIPEMNKVELLERADIFVMDNSLPAPFRLLADIVKKSKHVFLTEYPGLTIEECTQLVKLANESGSLIQVTNPHFFSPVIQWMNHHVSMPIFLDILDFRGEGKLHEKLYPIVLMLLDLTGISPKKVGAVTFRSDPNKSAFTNVRLEFGDASVANISFGSIEPLEEFKIRAYSRNQFITLNLSRNIYACNNEPIDLKAQEQVNELDWFFNTLEQKVKKKSCLEDFLIAMHLVQKIEKKINQFFTR